MKNFLKKQREILVILFYITLVSMLVYFVVFYLLGEIRKISDKIQEEQVKQESNKKRLEEIPRFKEQYKSLENVDLRQYLLDKDNAVSLIEKLETLASQTGNKIDISVQGQDSTKNVVKSKKGQEINLITDLPSDNYLQLKITLNGDYNSIVRFVKSLETFDYNSDIISIDIRNNKVSNNSNTNPFSSNGDKQSESDGKLEAILNTAFYSK